MKKKKFIDLLLDDLSPRIYSMCCKKRAVVKIDAFSGLLKDFVTVKISKNAIQLHNIFIIIISYMEINSRQLVGGQCGIFIFSTIFDHSLSDALSKNSFIGVC